MSYEALKWARVQRLHKTPKAVLAYLAQRSGHKDGHCCWPGQRTIASHTGMSERTVRNALLYLEEMGFLTRAEQRRKDGYRTSDTIELQVSDQEISVVSYGEWYAHNVTGRNRSHRQVEQISPAGAAGPKGESQEESQREDASSRLHVAASSKSDDVADTDARQYAHSEVDPGLTERMTVRVVDDMTAVLPGLDDQEVTERFLAMMMTDQQVSPSPLIQEANDRFRDALALEASKRLVS